MRHQATATSAFDGDWLSAKDAAALLEIKRQTLYAYVSRGMVRTRPTKKPRERAYLREDLVRLKEKKAARRSDAALAAQALSFGAPILESAVTEICPVRGPVYRGVPAAFFIRDKRAFVDVADHLFARRPSWGKQPLELPLPRDVRELRTFCQGRAPAEVLTLALTVLSQDAPSLHAPTPDAQRNVAALLLSRLPFCVSLAGDDARSEAALEEERFERSLLAALGLRVSKKRAALVRQVLVWCADHELNVSCFAARVAASTGAHLYACVQAALAAFSGPRHGAMAHRVHALVERVSRPKNASRVLEAMLGQGERVPGFSHPLYPDGDPRGQALLAAAKTVGGGRSLDTLTAFVDAYRVFGGPAPTLDVGLMAAAYALDAGPEAAMTLFAVGRTAGWLAHALEQREAGALMRPRARYVGRPAPPLEVAGP